MLLCAVFFFFSSRRRHTRFDCDWSSDVCSSDLTSEPHHLEEIGGGEEVLRDRREHRDFRGDRQQQDALLTGRRKAKTQPRKHESKRNHEGTKARRRPFVLFLRVFVSSWLHFGPARHVVVASCGTFLFARARTASTVTLARMMPP